MMRNEETRPLANLTGPLQKLVIACETNCVVGCCGADAFHVEADEMVPWIEVAGEPDGREALGQLERLISYVKELEAAGYKGTITSSEDDFNTVWPARRWREWLEKWKVQLTLALSRHSSP